MTPLALKIDMQWSGYWEPNINHKNLHLSVADCQSQQQIHEFFNCCLIYIGMVLLFCDPTSSTETAELPLALAVLSSQQVPLIPCCPSLITSSQPLGPSLGQCYFSLVILHGRPLKSIKYLWLKNIVASYPPPAFFCPGGLIRPSAVLLQSCAVSLASLSQLYSIPNLTLYPH